MHADFVPLEREITANYAPGEALPLVMHDGSRIVLRGVNFNNEPALACCGGPNINSINVNQTDYAQAHSLGANHVRWDILRFQFPDFFAGGVASAKAIDGSTITVTSSGTFLANSGNGQPQHTTGGGEWDTFAPDGSPTGGGTYTVTGLVRWEKAPGSLPAVIMDHIGDIANTSSGLVVLTIAYSDGDQGVLTVGCKLPIGSPPSLLEGITATKGYTAFWNSQQAVNGVDANRTLFHILP